MNDCRIEQRRREIGIKRKDLSEKLGVCPKTYYSYINGKPIPSDKLILLSRFLKCSSDYLLGIKDHTHITVTDHTGVVLADISQNEIIESDRVNVILS